MTVASLNLLQNITRGLQSFSNISTINTPVFATLSFLIIICRIYWKTSYEVFMITFTTISKPIVTVQTYSSRISSLITWEEISITSLPGVDPGFFLGGGALISCSNSTPINHIVFFWQIPVVLEKRRSSRGGGGAPPAPSL